MSDCRCEIRLSLVVALAEGSEPGDIREVSCSSCGRTIRLNMDDWSDGAPVVEIPDCLPEYIKLDEETDDAESAE